MCADLGIELGAGQMVHVVRQDLDRHAEDDFERVPRREHEDVPLLFGQAGARKDRLQLHERFESGGCLREVRINVRQEAETCADSR